MTHQDEGERVNYILVKPQSSVDEETQQQVYILKLVLFKMSSRNMIKCDHLGIWYGAVVLTSFLDLPKLFTSQLYALKGYSEDNIQAKLRRNPDKNMYYLPK